MTLRLLNTRSLRKHSLSDVDLLSNDVLCFTETQLYLHENTLDMTSKFQKNFRIYFNCNRDQHKSIAFGYFSSMLLHGNSDYEGTSVLLFKKPSFLDHLIKVALLYRSTNSSSSLFLENLMGWVNE